MNNQLSTVQEVLLASLLGGVKRLELLTRDLTIEQFGLSADREAYPGTWTIREIIHQLVDDGDVWSLRIKQAIAMPGTRVRPSRYPGDEAWAGALDFEDRDVAPALDLIKAHGAYLHELLSRFYNAWDHTIVIVDSLSGGERSLSVLQIVEMLVEHMDERLDQIEEIRSFNRV